MEEVCEVSDTTQITYCGVCGGLEEDLVCTRQCSNVLAKCVSDQFTYYLRVRTGEVFQFEIAEIFGEWLHLENCRIVECGTPLSAGEMQRGIDVRLSDIVWIQDPGS